MGIIHPVIDLMPHQKAERTRTEFIAFPDALTPLVPWMPLVPLIKKWAIDDDETRSCKLRRCARSVRQRLADAVVPLLPTIDHFLDSFAANPPEGAGALGSLVQASFEAQSLLLNDPEAGNHMPRDSVLTHDTSTIACYSDYKKPTTHYLKEAPWSL
jgi:hypothetical protein